MGPDEVPQPLCGRAARLGDEPEMEVRTPIHQGDRIDPLRREAALDGADGATQYGGEVGPFTGRHLAEVEEVPRRLDEQRARSGQSRRPVAECEVPSP